MGVRSLVRGSLVAALALSLTGGALAAAAESGASTPDSLARFTPRDTLSERLRRPSGVVVDAFGRITVADEERHSLERFGADGKWIDGAGALGSEPAQFRRPGTLVMLGSLGVAVHDRDNRRVVAYDQHLRLIGIVADFSSEALQSRFGRIEPVAITADAGGALRVADSDRDRVLAFDFAGGFVSEVGGFGGRAGAFRGLVAMASLPMGGTITLERGSLARRARGKTPDRAAEPARLQWLGADGRVVRSLGIDWARAESARAAIAVDRLGRVALVNAASGELLLLGRSGERLGAMSGLLNPSAVAFGPDGALWVAETGAARVRSLVIEVLPQAD